MEQLNHTQIFLGKVAKAFGIKGAVSLFLPNGKTQNLRPNLPICLKRPGQSDAIYMIESVLAGGRVFLQNVTTRNEAELLAGASLYVDRKEFSAEQENEFYWVDVLGAPVLDLLGNPIGTLCGIGSNNAQTLLEIKKPNGMVCSIPFVPEIVREIIPEQKCIIIDPPEGLLDLAYPVA